MFAKLAIISAIIFAVFVSADNTIACQCYLPLSSVAEEYESTKFVFTARLTSIEERDVYEGIIEPGGWMEVIKSYKGGLRPGDKVFFVSRTSCGVRPSKKWLGRENLIYTNDINNVDNKKIGELNACHRSGAADQSNPDIRYIENLEKYTGHTRLSGTYRFLSYFDDVVKKSIAEHRIKLTGNGKTYFLKVDTDGVFEIYDLPSGVYWAEPEVPDKNKYYLDEWDYHFTAGARDYASLHSRDPIYVKDATASARDPRGRFRVTIKAGQQREFEFSLGAVNSLNGKVMDSMGRSVKDVWAALVPTNTEDESYYYWAQDPRNPLAFRFKNIAIGEFYLRLTISADVETGDHNFKLYYPGTTDRSKAEKIRFAAGQHIKGLVFKVTPDTLKKIAEAKNNVRKKIP